MLRELLNEGGLYALSNILTKGISLFLIPFYTIYFSPADYGIIDILNLFTLFVNAVFSLQLYQGVARYIAEPSLAEKQRQLYASTGLWFSTAILLSITLIFVLIPDEFINMLSSETRIERSTFILASVVTLLNGIFNFLNVVLRFTRKALQVTILSFFHSVLGIGLILYFVMVKDWGIDSIYLSYLIIVPFLLLVQFYLLKDLLIMKMSKRALSDLVRFSLPLIPAAVSLTVMSFSDRIFIKYYLNDFNELGIYAMAAKFSTILALLVTGFSAALAPLIIEKHLNDQTKLELGRIYRLYLALGIIGVAVLSLFSKEIIFFTTASNFHGCGELLPIMFLTAYTVGFYMFSPGLLIQKKSLLSAVIVIVFALLNILLNFLLIPDFGLMGAAVATFISTFLYHGLFFILSQHYYPFLYNKFQSLLTIASLAALVVFLYFWQHEISWPNAAIKMVLAAVAVLLVHFSGLFRYNEMVLYLRKVLKKP